MADASTLAYRREWYAKNKDKSKSYADKWRAANPDKVRARARRWAANNRDKVRDSDLRRRYGISLAEYNSLLESQSGGCAICGNTDIKALHVDHDHNTNEVRGLLCGQCNRAIGLLGDDYSRVAKAARYLERI